MGAIAPRWKGPPVIIYLFQIKYSFEKSVIQGYNSILYSYVALSIKDLQQQLISLQVWLSASLSNRYWIAYKQLLSIFGFVQYKDIWFRW